MVCAVSHLISSYEICLQKLAGVSFCCFQLRTLEEIHFMDQSCSYFGHILKEELTEFVEELDMECERKKGIKGLRIFGLNNRKNKDIVSSSCLLLTNNPPNSGLKQQPFLLFLLAWLSHSIMTGF